MHETFQLMYMKHLRITVGLEIASIKRILAETFVAELICVAPNLLSVKSERSNYTFKCTGCFKSSFRFFLHLNFTDY